MLKTVKTLNVGESTPRIFHIYDCNVISILQGELVVEKGYFPSHAKKGEDGVNYYDLGLAALLHFLSFPPMQKVILTGGNSLEIEPLVVYRLAAVKKTYYSELNNLDSFTLP